MVRCPVELTNHIKGGKKTYQCDFRPFPSDPKHRCILHSTCEKDHEKFIQALKRFVDWSNNQGLPISCEEFVFPISDLTFLFEAKSELIFKQSIFGSPLDLSDFTFERKISFSGVKFHGDVDFGRAHFKHNVTFEGSEFLAKAVFKDTVFGSDVNFDKTKFSDEVNFDAAKISKGSFRSISFQGPVSFTTTNFSSEVNFHGTNFSATTNFVEAKFSGPSIFYRSQFSQKADFSLAAFADFVNLSKAVFEGEADFRSASFEEKLICNGTEFTTADFKDSGFRSGLHLRDSEFLKTVSFDGARFDGPIDMSGTMFSGGLILDNTMIPESERILFHRSKCNGILSLKSFRIAGQVMFNDSLELLEESKDAESPDGPWKIDLTAAHIVNPGGVVFQGWGAPGDSLGRIDVSRVYFALSNVQNIRFVHVKWGNLPAWKNRIGRLFRPRSRIDRVADEDRIRILPGKRTNPVRSEKQVSPVQVADVYKGLRQNYEQNLHYTEAGIFHIREMEMRRIAEGFPHLEKASEQTSAIPRWYYSSRAWIKRNLSFLSIYRISSNYGEHYRHAVVAIIIWFLGMALIDEYVKPYIVAKETLPFHGFFSHIFGTINHAISLVPGQIAGDDLIEFIARSVGIILIATFVISLRRSFRR